MLQNLIIRGSLALGLALAAATAGHAAPSPHGVTVQASATTAPTSGDWAIDGKVDRAWHAPFAAGGAPVTLSAAFRTERWLKTILVSPGDMRSDKTFAKYARPSRVRVDWDGGTRIVALADKRQAQAIDLGVAVFTTRVDLTVLEVYGAGDVALAEVAFHRHRDPLRGKRKTRDEIDRAIGHLATPDRADRAQTYLTRFGALAVPSLVRAVVKGTGEARSRALAALCTIGGDEAQQLVAVVLDGPKADRLMGLRLLERHPMPGSLERLVAFTQYTDREVAGLALSVLVKTAPTDAARLIADGLASGDAAREAAAVAAMAQIAPEIAIAVATPLRAHRDPSVRAAGLRALAQVATRSPEALATLRAAAATGAGDDRRAAYAALGLVDDDAVRMELLETVRGDDRAVIVAALNALVDQGDAGPTLLEAHLASLPASVMDQAVEAMARRATPVATRFLVGALTGGRWQPWHRRAGQLLAKRGTDAVADVVRWLVAHPRETDTVQGFLLKNATLAAPAAAQVLSDLGAQRAHTDTKLMLLEVLETAGGEGADVARALYENPRMESPVRRQAFDTFTRLGGHDEVAALVTATMRDPDPTLRGMSLHAAARMNLAAALPIVRKEIETSDPDLWTAGAVLALGTLDPTSLPFLRRHYRAARRDVRAAILDVALKAGSAADIALVVEAASSDIELRRTAQTLLASRD